MHFETYLEEPIERTHIARKNFLILVVVNLFHGAISFFLTHPNNQLLLSRDIVQSETRGLLVRRKQYNCGGALHESSNRGEVEKLRVEVGRLRTLSRLRLIDYEPDPNAALN